jgi:hypothetical protein
MRREDRSSIVVSSSRRPWVGQQGPPARAATSAVGALRSARGSLLLTTELLKRGFLGWLRGERGHCKMVLDPTAPSLVAIDRSRWSQSIVAGGRNRRSAHTWHIGVYVKCVENRVPSLLSADIRRDASAVRLMRVTCILLLLQLAIPSKLISIIADEHGAGAIA